MSAMPSISTQRYDTATLLGRQQYWRNEFRSKLGRAVADAHGLMFAYYDVKMGYPEPSAKDSGAGIVAPYPVVQSISSICFDPKDTEQTREIRVEWPRDLIACYEATERWVRSGGTQPPIPEVMRVNLQGVLPPVAKSAARSAGNTAPKGERSSGIRR